MRLPIILFIFYSVSLNGQSIKPYTIGIVVSDVEKATKWYEDVLELTLHKEMTFPKYDSLKINFLQGKYFQLELMEKKTSFNIEKYVSDYSLNDKPLIGFSKIAFSVSNITSLYERIMKLSATEVLGITEDKEFNSRYFIVKDLDGNLLQIIELKSDK